MMKNQRPSLSRRAFLGQVAVVSSTCGSGLAAQVSSADKREEHQKIEADVLVVGGGTAGAIAGIQAGRLGARTVVVESSGQLGGTMTTAGVDFPGLFHAWGKQIIAGIGWELVKSTVQMNSDSFPDFTVPTGRAHWRHQVRLCGGLYAALAEEECVKAGVQLRYYEVPTAIESETSGWKVQLVGKGTHLTIKARQIIDCTGNASVIGLLGLERVREKETQPGTLIYKLGGYEWKPEDAAFIKMVEDKAQKALASRELEATDFNNNIRGFLRAGGQNAMHVIDADSSTSEAHTLTNIRGRSALLRTIRFLKSLPGFEQLRIERLQAETGVRETYRIVGERTVTREDYVTGRIFNDGIAHSFYPVDLHDEKGVKPQHLKEGTVPVIPLAALIPRKSKNVLVAGRSISSDRLANSALRVQASCMAMGQAAGVVAALAAQTGNTPGHVDLREARRVLSDHGAIVP